MDDRHDLSNEALAECNDRVLCSAESAPIDSLSTLLSWCTRTSDDNSDGLYGYNIPKRTQRCDPNLGTNVSSGPLTLVCHDMKGGYLEDRFNNGHANRNAYRFYHWSLVDIFVYFSHHFVTIPPVGWIVAAHRNGVRCFGTLIIEHWAEFPTDNANNPNITKISGHTLISDLLLDHERIDQATTALARIASHYRFDGWLINIEAPIPEDKISLMEKFLLLLTAKCKQILSVPDEEICVLWYDSVVSDTGKLEWQNELNERNVRFFNACDGIFLNYCWTTAHLARSRQLVDNNEGTTRSRRNRIFVGVDVFGRGCLGGGGFACDVALAEIHKANLSIAIFAPGWTHETLGEVEFDRNERRFWSKLASYLYERCPRSLPLNSSFCQGFGVRRFRQGAIISNDPWFNLQVQQFQPCLEQQLDNVEDSNRFLRHLCIEDAFNGGSCLRLSIAETTEVTIFRTAIPLLPSQTNLQLTVVHKEAKKPPSKVHLLTLLKLRNILGNLDPIELDPERLNPDVPVQNRRLVKSIEASSIVLPNQWTRDHFVIHFHGGDHLVKELYNELTITAVNVTLQRSRSLLTTTQTVHSPCDDNFNYDVLIGHICLE